MSDTHGGSGEQYPPATYPTPYGQQPYGVPPAGATPPGQYPFGQQPYGGYAPHLYGGPGYGPPGFGRRDPNARPGTVLAAGIVTIVLSSLSLLGALLMLIIGIAFSSMDESALAGAGDAVTIGALVVAVWFGCSIAAILLAVFTLRRSGGARIALLVSSGLTIVVSLVSILGGGFGSVLTLFGAIAVIILLFTGGANEWFRGRHDVASV